MAQRDIKLGTKVMAKWPGSDKYFEATILEQSRTKFRVNFTDSDGYETQVLKQHVYVSIYLKDLFMY